MERFRTYLFPALFGFLVYLVIRLINDTLEHDEWWNRPWRINAIELAFTLLTAYLIFWLLRRVFRHFDQKLKAGVSSRLILRELFWVFLVTELCVYLVMMPMVALTDDGLSLGDFAQISIIPVMMNLIYYTIRRSTTLLEAYVNHKLQLEKMTNDHLQTELKFLKAQYHPHFLFNALNTVYFQMDEDVEAAKRSIEKFSGLLRYQLYDQHQQVPIHQEILYLQNFIELQQVRTSDKLKLTVHFDGTLQQQPIYPLLLLPFVENAFKYVGGQYEMRISATLKEGWLHFTVSNSLLADIPVKADAGIGLENLKRRLELLYPGRSTLQTGRHENEFTGVLTIKLDNDAA